MAKQSKRRSEDFDDFDDFEIFNGPDFDIDRLDEIMFDDRSGAPRGMNAWQRVEQRAETEWLRRQLTDWDDWDEYFETH